MYKFICDRINKTLASSREYTCQNIPQADLNYFKRIYALEPTIVNDISYGYLSGFMVKCVDPNYRYTTYYLKNKAKRFTGMFSRKGGKIARSRKSKRPKKSKKVKNN